MGELLTERYRQQLEAKTSHLTKLLAPFYEGLLDIFPSPPTHYRMRAEFRVWHDGDELDYIVFDQATKEKIKIKDFPAASEAINQLMPVLIERIKHSQILRQKIFQIDFLSTLSGELLVTLLYHRQLDDAWKGAALSLRDSLRVEGFQLDFIGRARKQRILLDRDHVIERLILGKKEGERELVYQQIENSFTQPNTTVATLMIAWAQRCSLGKTDSDLVELYCGNANFAIALSDSYRRILATELAKPSIRAAEYNIKANGVKNLAIARLSAEEFTEAIEGVRDFNRLKEAAIHLPDYHFSTILVDPPRAGIDDATLAMMSRFEHIIYISCNPNTLATNLEILNQTHKVTKAALFDQFPFTSHIESGVYLEKR